MKKFIDISLSLVALLLLLPIFIIICIAIKSDSKGPIVFKQQRVGIDNKLFTIYKFRTMRTDTPNLPTHLLADPSVYITRVGRVLRKTSLDEIPQIFNIIRGEMSLVGPRPALYNQNELIQVRKELGIHQIPPGLTGWAQINGRDDISEEQKARLDYYYLKHQSIWFDFKIMFKTVSSTIAAKGVKA
ncbi:sugar transferase [Paenibacillus radicis (ex Xue et al. 2023)]|uniref:Sugar transferase n=1 Tax=Paenibacillus radicis (ex Xue et al. 2023) TaxID=2972489 RepID=A0ABT1YJ13_9BACL|nr:sugar transferase [Paenibacillus radicis (ex Xue et al. 2023)]MCR8632414.1 sugar transferase [Paenibacillus radicis (ex Xue et al. 2023)]